MRAGELKAVIRVDSSRFDEALEQLGAAAEKLQAAGKRLATINLDAAKNLVTMVPSPFLTATLKALAEAEAEEHRRAMVDAGELEE